MEKYIKQRLIAAVAIFTVFAIIYFINPIAIPHKICIPLFTLTIFSIGILPWPICLALAFSALGDLSGSFKYTDNETASQIAFLGQIGAFAIAHVFFIIYFYARGLKAKLAARPKTKKQKKARAAAPARAKGEGLYLALCLLLCVGMFYFVMTRIIIHTSGVIHTGAIVYATLIITMFFGALMQKDWIFGLGAAMFVFSDTILAWNSFVEPIAAQRYLIMIPYYGAQITIFLRVLWFSGKCANFAPAKAEIE